MRIGSLFSGAGGLDLAVEHVFGASTAWHSEIDPAASKVLAHRWPDVPNLGDITTVDWDTVDPVGILCGGFPCQDVSAAGRRAGIKDGTRSGLWASFADAIAALRPPTVIIENVRGLLSATAHRPMEPSQDALGDGDTQPVLRAIGAVLGDLSDLGYDAKWATVAASSIGAPHRRERVFILASDSSRQRHGRRQDGAVVGRVDCSNEAQSGQRQRARKLAGDRSTASAGDVVVLPTPAARDWRGASQADMRRNSPGMSAISDLLPTPGAADGNGGKQRSQAALDGANGKRQHDLPNIARLLPTPSASDGVGGGPNNPENRLAQGHQVQLLDLGMATAETWGKYGAAISRWEQIVGPAPSPTEANRNGKPRLNPRFSEWMMGWPAGWATDVPGISRNDQLRIIGNGVVPQCAAAALEWLLGLELSGVA